MLSLPPEVTWFLVAVLSCFLVASWIISCGDPRKNDACGRASWFVGIWIPGRLWACTRVLHLEWLLHGLRFLFDCCCMRHNPIVQIGYLILTVGGYVVVISKAYPLVPNLYMDAWHKWVGIGVMASCLWTFFAASFADPGVITEETLANFDNHPYDHRLYQPTECPTCKLRKPARSKHCSVSNKCIARFDHYCIWLNNAVGERNYRWFIAFLIVHVIMLVYGALAVLSIFATEVEMKQLFRQTFVYRETGERLPASWSIIIQYFLHIHAELMGVLLLCAVMAVVVAGFAAYHLFYLAGRNQTTNESIKYGSYEVKRFYKAEERRDARRRWREQQEELRRLRALLPAHANPASDACENANGLDGDGVSEGGESARAIMAQCDALEKEAGPMSPLYGEGPDDMQPAHNIWDHGSWWENWKEVFWPLSVRPPSKRPWGVEAGKASMEHPPADGSTKTASPAGQKEPGLRRRKARRAKK